MPGENRQNGLEPQAVAFLEALLVKPGPPAPVPPELAAVEGFEKLYTLLAAFKEAAFRFSNGEFHHPLPMTGATAGYLKTLQSNLRHLAWQCHSVASGDLAQRVDFMGELSEAFNLMVEGLVRQNETIRQKQNELSRVTKELWLEIKKKEEMETALRASEEMYRQKSLRDPLTGLYNRGYFFESASREVENMKRRPGDSCCVVMMDIDHFKKFNDTHGHLCGDQAIRLVAETVNQILRKGDIFARYGGEEFALLLAGTDLERGAVIAERIRVAVSKQPSPAKSDPRPITLSLGLAGVEAGRLNPMVPGSRILLDALAAADAALYAAKEHGRNLVRINRDWQWGKEEGAAKDEHWLAD